MHLTQNIPQFVIIGTMIRKLRGTVDEIGHNFIVIDVGGVGYHVYTTSPSVYLLKDQISVHTYMAVRENALDIYGFADRDTLEVFELLIELPKIGPKSALQILTAADITLLKEAVRNNDPGYLSKLSGIGKKSAEKIVTGLKDKIEGLDVDSYIDGQAIEANHQTDTIDALISLGYPAQDARRIVIKISTDHPELVTSAEVIRIALRQMN